MNDSIPSTRDDPAVSPAPDSQLLAQFIRQRDEQAFAELATRHGALVLGVCRRILRDEHEVEDALQAVFLVLARDAAKIRKQKSLASWLYGVAYRTAVRAAARRHRRRETELSAEPMQQQDTLAEVASRHQQQLVDDELNRLPQQLRDPLVLRYLLGQTNEQVAAELGVSVSAVEGRLKRGKSELRVRLARRGVGFVAALAAIQAAQSSVEAATVKTISLHLAEACAAYASGNPSAAGYSTSAAELAAKEQIAMLSLSPLAKAACAAAVLCAVIAAVGFAGQGSGQGQSAGGQGQQIIVSGQRPNAGAAPQEGAVTIGAGQTGPGGFGSARGGYGSASGTTGAQSAFGSRYGTTGTSFGAIAGPSRQAVDLKEKSVAEKKIEAALAEQTTIDFLETPLSDVVLFLEDHHDLQIELDARALDDIGIGSDTPITKSIGGISLQSALDLILKELDLDYLIDNEVLEITTAEVAEETCTTHVYDVSRLAIISPAEDLAEIIQATVQPKSWRQNPNQPDQDPADSVGSISAANGALVVSHNRRAHEQIADLLAQLSRVGAQQGAQ